MPLRPAPETFGRWPCKDWDWNGVTQYGQGYWVYTWVVDDRWLAAAGGMRGGLFSFVGIYGPTGEGLIREAPDPLDELGAYKWLLEQLEELDKEPAQ